jgi:hypothetical protein
MYSRFEPGTYQYFWHGRRAIHWSTQHHTCKFTKAPALPIHFLQIRIRNFGYGLPGDPAKLNIRPHWIVPRFARVPNRVVASNEILPKVATSPWTPTWGRGLHWYITWGCGLPWDLWRGQSPNSPTAGPVLSRKECKSWDVGTVRSFKMMS